MEKGGFAIVLNALLYRYILHFSLVEPRISLFMIFFESPGNPVPCGGGGCVRGGSDANLREQPAREGGRRSVSRNREERRKEGRKETELLFPNEERAAHKKKWIEGGIPPPFLLSFLFRGGRREEEEEAFA